MPRQVLAAWGRWAGGVQWGVGAGEPVRVAGYRHCPLPAASSALFGVVPPPSWPALQIMYDAFEIATKYCAVNSILG